MAFRRIQTMCNRLLFSLLIAPSIDAYPKCGLESTPLTYERKFSEFTKSDRALNHNYEQLMKRLDNPSRRSLRAVQHEWIDWRDDTCDEIENGCQIGSCAGVAHDTCIIDLTNQRNDELKGYLSNLGDAKAKQFSFSKEYKAISNSPTR